MRTTFLILIAFCTLSSSLFAQKEQSDPAARAILQQVREKYEAYSTIEAAFSLDIQFPEEEKMTQQGTLARSGTKYRVRFGDQEALCDGQAIYLVLHNNKSIQINSMPAAGETENLLTPESIFNFYDNGSFIYTLADTRTESGKVCHFIEFKPTDRNSEYAKLRMVVVKDTKEVLRVQAFAKDGSQYTFKLTTVTPNKRFAADHFTFTKTKYPGYYIEDLRD